MSSSSPETTDHSRGSIQPRRRMHIAARLLLFAGFTLLVLFPRVDLLFRHAQRWRDMESLIQPELPEIRQMNLEIDALLPPAPTPELEIKTVENYVLNRIRYVHDWDQWGNTDYWPDAAEVCASGAEDCDGRAVLAVSILRSRGFPSAALAASLNHMWAVTVPVKGSARGEPRGLMGPDAQTTLQRTTDGKTEISLPGWNMIREMISGVQRFPAVRVCLILAAALLTLHPLRSRFFWPGLTSLFCAFVLVLDWAVRKESSGSDSQLMAGLTLCFFTLLAAAFTANRTRPVSS